MSVWAAIGWGAATSASLWLGQALARPMAKAPRVTGLVMGFGAGTLLSAVAYQLLPAASLTSGVRMGLGLAAGALVYYLADRLVDRRGGSGRQQIKPGADGGSGLAMFLGALLDGLPEALVLGIGLAVGGEISLAFVVAVFVSNIPQSIAPSADLAAAGWGPRRLGTLWTGVVAACAVAAALGGKAGRGKIVAVVSGGNIDLPRFTALIA